MVARRPPPALRRRTELQEELQAIKQRMEGMEHMIAKMKTLFA